MGKLIRTAGLGVLAAAAFSGAGRAQYYPPTPYYNTPPPTPYYGPPQGGARSVPPGTMPGLPPGAPLGAPSVAPPGAPPREAGRRPGFHCDAYYPYDSRRVVCSLVEPKTPGEPCACPPTEPRGPWARGQVIP